MSATELLQDCIGEIEAALADSDLGLKTIDRIGDLANCTPEELLHKGATVQCLTTTNLSGSPSGDRDQDRARVEDTYLVQVAYRIAPVGSQKASRDKALLLEEQVRVLLTRGALRLHSHLRYQRTTRGLHPRTGEWWIASLTFVSRRGAALGGG